jgi:hypothetical protein
MQTFAVSSLLAFFYGAIGATSTASWLAIRRESAAAARHRGRDVSCRRHYSCASSRATCCNKSARRLITRNCSSRERTAFSK